MNMKKIKEIQVLIARKDKCNSRMYHMMLGNWWLEMDILFNDGCSWNHSFGQWTSCKWA